MSRSAVLGATLLAAPPLLASTETYYDIAAGDAAEALRRFSEVSGHQILFSAKLVRGVRTARVDGTMTAEQALAELLRETGLTAVFDEDSDAVALTRSAATKRAPRPRSRFSFRALAAGLATISANLVFSQTAPSGTGQPTPIQLSPFEVSADQDQGYIATNTLSGSRVNTALYTTPSVTSVFTRDFLDDIAANDLVEAYAYALNTQAQEQPGQSSNFRGNIFSDNAVNIRGLNAQTARNYFVWTVNGDSYNLERLDFSRGPNNILFGLGGQGGVVNSTTKRAILTRDITRIQLRVGDWDLYRGHIDVNRPIGKNLALRVNVLKQEEGNWVNHAEYNRFGVHLAGTWSVFEGKNFGTTFRAEYEQLDIDRVIGFKFPLKDSLSNWNGMLIPQSGALTGIVGTGTLAANRRVYDQASGEFFQSNGVRISSGPSGTSFADESIMPREMNLHGPDNTNNSDVENMTFVLEQRLFENLFMELAFNRQIDDMEYNQIDSWQIYRDPRGFIGTGASAVVNPRAGEYFAQHEITHRRNGTEVDETRFTISYEKDLGKFGRHQVAGLISRRDNTGTGEDFQFDDLNFNQRVLIRRWISDGDSARFTAFNPAQFAAEAAGAGLNVGYRQTALNYSENRNDTAQIVHVGTFLKGALTTIYGVRKDELFNRGVLNGTSDGLTGDPLFKSVRTWNDFQLQPWQDTAEDITRTMGATLSWSENAPIRFYYNQSESFVNQNGVLFAGLTDRVDAFPPRVGEGKDMGMRFRFFENRVQGSIGYFETEDIGQRHFLHGFFPQSTQFVARDLLGLDYRGWQDTIDVSADGYEIEITANPTKNLRLHFNYAHTELVNSNHAPRVKEIMFGQLVPEWQSWASGWRQAADETLPAGVGQNSAPAVNVPGLGRPLTFLEAHGNGIDPAYALGDRSNLPTVTGTVGLSDWISRVNWASDIWFTDGLAPRRHRLDTFNVVANYTFDRTSFLNGWTIGGGARWRGKPIIDRFFDADSKIVDVFGKPRIDTDLNIGYSRKFERFTLRTQLAIKNILNDDLIEVVNVAGNADERGHLQFNDPRSFRFTVDFIF